MDSLIYSLNATMPVFLTILIGYILKRVGMLGEGFTSAANKFNFKVTLPALLFADLATIPMAETALPLIHGIIPILTLAVLHYLLSFLSRKSLFLRKIINGKPQIVISPNGIEYSTLKQLDLNINDLIEGIRGCGYFNLEEILYAIIQTNGTITVLPRGAYAPLTANDIKLEKEKASLPIIVFAEGKFIHENMNIAKIDEGFLNTKIENAGFKKLTEILLITLNTQGKMYIQPKNGSFVTIETEYKGEGKW